MAVTAAMTLSSATATAPGKVTATCTITNSTSADVNVTGIDTLVSPTGRTEQSVAVQCGFPALGPGVTVRVAASGTLAFNWSVQAFAPFSGEGLANPTSSVYDVGAIVHTDATGADSLVTASMSNLTVSPPTH